MSTFMNFVFILSVLVSRTTGMKKKTLKDQLAKSLTNVGEIINNIEDKIDQERKILSQIEYDLNHQTTGGIDYDTTDIWWNLSNTTNQLEASTTPEEISTTMTILPKYFVETTSTFPTLPHHWKLPTAATDSPFVQDLKKTMILDKHGYFTASLTRATELVYTKGPSESYPVIEQIHYQCKKYLDDGKFNSLGETLTSGLEMVLTEWFPKVTPISIHQQAGVLHFMLKDKNRALTDEINEVINFYDGLFTTEEGQELFASLEPLYDFPNENITAAELSERIFGAAISPYARIEGKRQQKRLIQLIYMAVDDIAPQNRAVPASSLENTDIEGNNQSSLPVRRNMNNKNKISQDIHFSSKHPILLKKIKRQYKQDTKKYNHHPSRDLKHHHSYRNRHDQHRRHLYERKQTRLSSVRSNEPDEEVEGDTSESSAYYDGGNLKAHHQQNTHNRQRTTKNNKRLKLKQHRQKQMKTKQRQRKHHNGNRRTAKRRQDNLQYNKPLRRSFIRKKQLSQNFKRFNVPSSEELSSQLSYSNSMDKDLLHKIREVSSYSDEEDHLRNNLYDALRHGNRTIVSFRKAGGDLNNKQPLRDLSSETDQEWVFKNNIYKVFEQI